MNKHDNHQIEIIEGPFEYEYTGKTPSSWLYKNVLTNKTAVSHPGKIMCKTCNVYIKWANKYEIMTYKEIYQPGMTFKEYTKTTNDYMHSTSEHDPANIFLAVPFRDKDIVKKLGATWDPYHKLWYTTVRRQHADKLTQYMMPDDIEKLKQFKRSANK